MGVHQTPMHLLRPGDRGKSVLRVLDGSRGEVEPGERGLGGGNRVLVQEVKRRGERREISLGMIHY